MLCQKCHRNPATVKYAEVVDGTVVQQDLCQECLDTYQTDVSSAFSLGSARPAVHTPAREARLASRPPSQGRDCPSCGDTLSRVMKTASVGCPACYRHFGADIESVLEGIHPGMRHQGKAPALNDGRARVHEQLKQKRALLRSVLAMEDYEQAAALRDEIKRLEASLKHPGPELD